MIQGREVPLPVEIRQARVASAMFAVDARTAQEVIAYSGLEAVRPLPGRAICSLAFVEYVDGDLGPYHEFAVAFLVHAPDAPHAPGNIGAFIHWLPVDGDFTLDAGRTIWGFPKVITRLPLDWSSPHRCAVWQDDRLVVALSVRPGFRTPAPKGPPRTVTAYSCLDGTTRRTPWSMEPSGVTVRPGGAAVRLGDHPAADDLHRLGLGRLPALSSSTVERLRMSFGPATPV